MKLWYWKSPFYTDKIVAELLLFIGVPRIVAHQIIYTPLLTAMVALLIAVSMVDGRPGKACVASNATSDRECGTFLTSLSVGYQVILCFFASPLNLLCQLLSLNLTCSNRCRTKLFTLPSFTAIIMIMISMMTCLMEVRGAGQACIIGNVTADRDCGTFLTSLSVGYAGNFCFFAPPLNLLSLNYFLSIYCLSI